MLESLIGACQDVAEPWTPLLATGLPHVTVVLAVCLSSNSRRVGIREHHSTCLFTNQSAVRFWHVIYGSILQLRLLPDGKQRKDGLSADRVPSLACLSSKPKLPLMVDTMSLAPS